MNGGRIVTGFLVFAAVTAAVVAGDKLVAQDPPAASGTTVSIMPARQDVACPGPQSTPSGVTGTDPELGGAATGVSASTYLTGAVRPVGAGQASEALVGATVHRVSGGDITGLAAVTCTAPSTDQWVVGGATTVGASARLVLTNPSDASVQATVTSYGELGELDSREVAIGPNAQGEVLLEGLTIDVAALAVHISSTGTGVVAALQDSRLNGFQPFGSDWVTASAVGTQLALPGVGTDGYENQRATVRLLAPEGATARLILATPEGAALWEGVTSLDLQPGVAVEVSVPAVDVGTVIITADSPVVAGAIVQRTRPATTGVAGDTAQELRWVAGQLADDDNERSAVTVGYDERVVAYSAQGGTFTLADAEGRTVASAVLGPGGMAAVPVKVAPGTVLTATGPFAWNILLADKDFVSALTPTRTTIDPVAITVEQRRYVPSP